MEDFSGRCDAGLPQIISPGLVLNLKFDARDRQRVQSKSDVAPLPLLLSLSSSRLVRCGCRRNDLPKVIASVAYAVHFVAW